MTENPKDDLEELLTSRTISAGHMLSFEEASKDPEMVQPNCYAPYYGSFEKAAKYVWLELHPPVKDVSGLTKYGRQLHAKQREALVRKKIVKYERGKKNMGSNSVSKGKYNAETVKRSVIEFYERNGRFPRQSECMKESGLPSWATLVCYLGPRTEWETLLGEQIGVSSVSVLDETCADSNSTTSDEVLIEEDDAISMDEVVIEKKDVVIMDEVVTEEKDVTIVNENTTKKEDASADKTACVVEVGHNDGEAVNDKQIVAREENGAEAVVESRNVGLNGSVGIELKISLLGRKDPICLTLTV